MDKLLIITATRGHFVELDIDKPYYGGIYEDNKLVTYFKEIQGKEGIIKTLRGLAEKVDKVIVATDPDAEGEKIAWDVLAIIKPYNNVKRAIYHEVTKKVIINAINNPQDFDPNLLKAQILRIEDAWIGLSLSKIVQDNFNNKGLSAGRVQTPVLGWIVTMTEENKKYRVEFVTMKLDNNFILSSRFPRGTYAKLKNEKVYLLSRSEEITVREPLPPYTTDTLLSDAVKILKINTKDAMQLAQDLFEAGFITYHRTDSTQVMLA